MGNEQLTQEDLIKQMQQMQEQIQKLKEENERLKQKTSKAKDKMSSRGELAGREIIKALVASNDLNSTLEETQLADRVDHAFAREMKKHRQKDTGKNSIRFSKYQSKAVLDAVDVMFKELPALQDFFSIKFIR